MREIKFRAFCPKYGQWVYGATFAPIDGSLFYTADGDEVNVNPDTIGQFTSLKDKNGKDIYEDDIIEVRGGHKRVVVWDVIGYALMPCEDYHDKTLWAMNLQHPDEDRWNAFLNEIEVIGNIHDNPQITN